LLENKQSSQVLGNIVKDALFNPKTEYGDLNTLEVMKNYMFFLKILDFVFNYWRRILWITKRNKRKNR
jgi:hypothetical protein